MSKVLVIIKSMGIGDLSILISNIHAISKKVAKPVTVLAQKNTRAHAILKYDPHIEEVIELDEKEIKSFFSIIKKIKPKQFDQSYIYSDSIRLYLISKLSGIKENFHYKFFSKKGKNFFKTAKEFTEKTLNTEIDPQSKIYCNNNDIVEAKKKAKEEAKRKEEEAKRTYEEELEEQLSEEEITGFQLEKTDMDKMCNRVCEIIADYESDGILQSQLWKKFKLSSRDGSRLALKLERMGNITREKILEKERWTYKLIIKKTPVSTKSIEGAPCLTCPVEAKCSLDGEISPKTCQWIEDWVMIELKNK